MEALALLGVVVVVVFIGLHDVAQYFLQGKASRKYWFKWWLIASIAIGFVFWLALMYTGK